MMEMSYSYAPISAHLPNDFRITSLEGEYYNSLNQDTLEAHLGNAISLTWVEIHSKLPKTKELIQLGQPII